MKPEMIRKLVLPACREFDVRRLDLFGSVARGEEKEFQDLDFLVEFDNPDQRPSKRFFGLLHFLEDVLKRPVDLVTAGAISNPYFRERIMKERKNVYDG